MPTLDTIGPMQRNPPPHGFETGRPPTPDELRSLPEASHEAIKTLERCITLHHVAEVDYTDASGQRRKIRIRPASIRYNVAEHLVVWGIPTDEEHWEELRFDRIHAVRDTGEGFTPTW